MAAASTASASHLWYVQASGQVWGPYTEARMVGFVAEGRVAALTPVSPWRDGPFAPAAEMMDLAALRRPPTPAPKPPAAAPGATIVSGPVRPLLVWATLSAGTAGRFQAALSAHGSVAGLRPGLWLVQARTDAAGLRNALSRGLAADETLLVVEAPLDRTAWFNLAQSAERELRQFWGG